MIGGIVDKIRNVDFELTYLCNLKCLHCYNPTRTKTEELPTEKVKSITQEIQRAGFGEIHFNGGEPLLRKDILEILRHSSSVGLATILETNAVLLSNPEILAGIKNLRIRASIDGSEKSHNKLRRSRLPGGAYKTALGNLSKAVKYGIPVQATCSVNRINYFSIYDMAREALSYGIRDIRLRLTMPAGFAHKNWGLIKMKREELEQVIQQSEKISEDFPEIQFGHAFIKRNVPRLEPKFFIDPRGLVKPYPFIENFAGDLKIDSVERVLMKIPGFEFSSEQEKMVVEYLSKLGMVQND